MYSAIEPFIARAVYTKCSGETDDQFPNTFDEITGARCCYAVEQPIADVFRCIGMLKYGLYFLIGLVNVRFRLDNSALSGQVMRHD
jgi:hypothetical protein